MADLNICRVCLVHSNNEELISIYQYGPKIPSQVFSVAGVRIMEFTSYNVPALICHNCLNDLKIAIKFRTRCRNNDIYFRNLSREVEDLLWKTKKFLDECDGAVEEDDTNVKVEDVKCEVVEEYLESDHNEDDFYNIIEVDDGNQTTEASEKNFQCSFCSQEFSLVQDLEYHLKVNHTKNISKSFNCNMCEKTFAAHKSLRRHLSSVHGCSDIFKCSDCNSSFESLRMLTIHQNKFHESEGQEFPCSLCEKVFPTRRKVKKHISDIHNRMQRRKAAGEQGNCSYGPCQVCGKFLKSKVTLQIHERNHLQQSQPIEHYYCDLCGNKFKFKSALGTHIKVRHLKKIRFSCPESPDRSYSTKHAMLTHYKVVHQNIRDHCCEMCGKAFGSKEKLTAHVRIHTGERPFKCKFCDKCYTHQTDLIRHVWSHTGERRYTCQICKLSFIKKSLLQSHRCIWKN